LAGRREGDTKLDGSQPAHPDRRSGRRHPLPIDEDRNANVQVYFTGTTEATASTRFNLNRMLVRSGWALVDLHTPTAINLQQWLNDQEYAKRARLGLWGNQATLDWVYRALLVPRPRVTTGGGRIGRAVVVSPAPNNRVRTTEVTKTGRTNTTVSPPAIGFAGSIGLAGSSVEALNFSV
jgi:hypothetical protein